MARHQEISDKGSLIRKAKGLAQEINDKGGNRTGLFVTDRKFALYCTK